MSGVVQYVGFFHVLKDYVKETWTQFWENSSSPTDQCAGDTNEKEINFRSRVKVKLEKMRQQSIHVIDRSSNEQEDYSHLTRPKTRKELMQISAAVMGIEFAYAAETAFVSPLLLNIGLRHRQMTLIWCLSPLLGFFLTPILGSLSDGCRSSLGRRRPFILLLSIGVVLGLILVPNGKTIGRMMGDTYADDEPPDMKPSSELTARLLLAPNSGQPMSSVRMDSNQTESSEMPEALSKKLELLHRKQSFNNSKPDFEKSTTNTEGNSLEDERPSYKRHSSKYLPMELAHGFRARNSLFHKDKDLDQIEFFKTLGRKDKTPKINQETFRELVFRATKDEEESKEDKEDGESSTDSPQKSENPQQNSSEGKLSKPPNADRKSPFQMSSNRRAKETSFNSGREEENNMSRSKRLAASGKESVQEENESSGSFDSGSEDAVKSHFFGLIFTVIGTVLLDFDADACQSPSRAYMLDVTIPEDHAKGLSTFTIMAGLGGSIGYFLGALNWENTFMGRLFGGHVRAVFTLVLFIFVACVIATVRSFREIPIDRLWANKPGDGLGETLRGQPVEPKPKPNIQHVEKAYSRLENDSEDLVNAHSNTAHNQPQKSYGTIQETSFNAVAQPSAQGDLENPSGESIEEAPKFREYVKTIVQLPRSLQWLCATNFFCWMSLVCYSLYFTDFVGEAVFGGDPAAPRGSPLKEKYDEGVRFGCWGMSLYSLSCSIYSICIESLVNRFGARRVYIYGQLVYSVGMVLMALARHPAGVIIFSWTAGIMYATLFTMPYLLVARYHAAETFDIDVDDMMEKRPQVRGLGTDVAIVSSMVFLAQITQALTLGVVVTVVGSTTAIVCAAAVFASCGAVCATKVLYLDL